MITAAIRLTGLAWLMISLTFSGLSAITLSGIIESTIVFTRQIKSIGFNNNHSRLHKRRQLPKQAKENSFFAFSHH
jgi:hypothetical protein